MQWNALTNDYSDVTHLKILFTSVNQENETIWTTDVNASKNSVNIGNLGKFVNYTVWIKSFSKRGLGFSSFPINVRTLEEGKSVTSDW